MTKKINMLAIDLAKGSFQVCAVGPEGMVLYNRGLSRTRLATLLGTADGAGHLLRPAVSASTPGMVLPLSHLCPRP